MNKTSPFPSVKDGSTCHLSAGDLPSFFQHQWDQCLSAARAGGNTDLNFVSKTGDKVSGHQAVLLPLSSHLKALVESCKSCGCAEDVPTLLLPDWSSEVIEALVNLIYSGSAHVTGDAMEELLKLKHELRIDIPVDQLFPQPIVLSSETALDDNSSEQEMDSISIIKIENTETEKRNEEQEKVIKKLSGLLSYLEHVTIKNEESFVMIMKPLENLLSCWKYLPTESSFDKLPTEIKSQILSYLCNSGALLAASVSTEWKKILKKRLIKMKEIRIGMHCSNMYECEDCKCFMAEEILKASITVNLDVRLKICHPITDIDPSLLAEALVKVSEFDITDECKCGGYEKDSEKEKEVITQNQMEVLFDNLDQKRLRLTSLGLSVNMNDMDQDKLLNCIFKAKRFLLGFGSFLRGELEWLVPNFIPCLDGEKFINKLSQNAHKGFSQLYLERLEYPFDDDDLTDALFNGLCKTKTLYLGRCFRRISIEDLIKHILTHPIRMKSLSIFQAVDWNELITTEELVVLLNKLKMFTFYGTFTPEQVDAAWDIPDIYIIDRTTYAEDLYLIWKGINLAKIADGLNGGMSQFF